MSPEKKPTSNFNIKGTETGRIEEASENVRRFGKILQRIKEKRRRWFKRRREALKETVEKGEGIVDERGKIKKGLFGRLREPGRFFSKERIKERHDFRIKVSSNRKWIMIGVAVLAICVTVVYLSVTYGGGGFGFVTKFLGVFK